MSRVSGLLSGFVKAFRHRKALAYIRPGDRVLDGGSGLAEIVDMLPPGVDYTGVERDPVLLARSRALHPDRAFLEGDFLALLPGLPAGQDVVLLLAVLEHAPDPGALLRAGAALLKPQGRLVVTTPAPAGGPLHALGARLGLFSSMASEEHHALLDRRTVEALAREAGLRTVAAGRFLLGLNQLFVFGK